MIYIDTKYYRGDVEIRYVPYVQGGLCICLREPNGDHICKATICLPNEPLPKGYVWMKGWGENVGIPEALEKAGIIHLSTKFVRTGFVQAQKAKVIDPNRIKEQP